MSWEEHAAAPAACFQGKALALPPGPAKPAVSRSGLWTLSAACWRGQASAELCVHQGALTEAMATAVDAGQSQLGCGDSQLLPGHVNQHQEAKSGYATLLES